ncbi:apolipoprotein C-III [Erinaceus europaeus]|uniref:Apolipoprotein C-III n=1 Tax=Erinaceus europaeus TaxID=9365 RepID=A0A1S2ZQQ3_ERIEU|nr:apolipoprotein C-III [Erinaceus europaeus]
MRPQVLLAIALVVLVASARAQDPVVSEEPSILDVMQDYVHQATKTAQDALTSVQKFQVAEQARGWMSTHFSTLHDYWSTIASTVTGFWEPSAKVEPTPPSEVV